MQLRTRATDDEIAYLRRALAWLDAEAPFVLDRLLPVSGPRRLVPALSPALTAPLEAFGLVAREGDHLRGLHRLRRIGGRFYVLELGLGDTLEYFQDVWPETDALLATLDGLAPGSLCDLGTGSGVCAIEAAARGHRVVATDLFETALALARFNARLNGLLPALELRQGSLWEALAPGARFDCILTNPHYGRVDDQLRVEVLRGARDHLAPGGRLRLATVLEWQGPHGLGLEPLLRELGGEITVTPLESPLKRDWFHVARADDAAAPLVSRQRFVVDVRPDAEAAVRVSWPAAPPVRDFVPLARLAAGPAGAAAYVADAGDAEALAVLLGGLRQGGFQLPVAPRQLLDACRFGAQLCVESADERGAAAAIVARDGRVRPCSAGEPIGDVGDSTTTLRARLEALRADADRRRGCASCAARAVCSRCLFPAFADEARFCALVRAEADALPLLHLLMACLDAAAGASLPLVEVEVRALVQPERSLVAVWLGERGFAAWARDAAAVRGGARLSVTELTPAPLSLSMRGLWDDALALPREDSERRAILARLAATLS